jgi:hypothetical protein
MYAGVPITEPGRVGPPPSADRPRPKSKDLQPAGFSLDPDVRRLDVAVISPRWCAAASPVRSSRVKRAGLGRGRRAAPGVQPVFEGRADEELHRQ